MQIVLRFLPLWLPILLVAGIVCLCVYSSAWSIETITYDADMVETGRRIEHRLHTTEDRVKMGFLFGVIVGVLGVFVGCGIRECIEAP